VLSRVGPLPAAHASDGEPILPGWIYIAPPDYHLLFDSGFFALSTEAPYRYSRPSIDITFEAAASSYDGDAIGVVLTGANQDGADGLRRIVARGGTAIVQDPETAESPTMPRAALAAVPTAKVLPIEEIAGYLTTLVARRAKGARPLGRTA
jgi:two-component system chemotaxis response regulator CheB